MFVERCFILAHLHPRLATKQANAGIDEESKETPLETTVLAVNTPTESPDFVKLAQQHFPDFCSVSADLLISNTFRSRLGFWPASPLSRALLETMR